MKVFLNRRILVGVLTLSVIFFGSTQTAFANGPSKISGWKTSCGVDRGTLQKSKTNYVFLPSKNHCDGHKPWGWKQRTEIVSKKYSPRMKGKYVFQSTISLKSSAKNTFDVFQLHDGRSACAPPLKVEWNSKNQISFLAAYRVAGKGEEHCIKIRNFEKKNFQRGQTLRRDGTEYLLQVFLDFDGTGAFTVEVAINNKIVNTGAYSPNLPAGPVKSVTGIQMNSPKIAGPKNYYFKHGVYSKEAFQFELRSSGMSMFKVK
jgi:hypothetical protein